MEIPSPIAAYVDSDISFSLHPSHLVQRLDPAEYMLSVQNLSNDLRVHTRCGNSIGALDNLDIRNRTKIRRISGGTVNAGLQSPSGLEKPTVPSMTVEEAEDSFYKIWSRVYIIKNPENKPKIRKKKYVELMTETECLEMHKLFKSLGYSDKCYSRKLKERNSKLRVKHTTIKEARAMLAVNHPVRPPDQTREILLKLNSEKNKTRQLLTERFGKTHESSHALIKRLIENEANLREKVEMLEKIVEQGLKRGLRALGATEIPVPKKRRKTPELDLQSMVPSFYTSQHTTAPVLSTSFGWDNETNENNGEMSQIDSEVESDQEYVY